MDRLLPPPLVPVDVYDAYRPADPAAALVRLNMVVSADGHVVDATGVSGGLGGAADLAGFSAMRHLADAVMAGAGTVRAEGYGPMRLRAALADRRRADGRPGPAPIVVVSGSLDLDLTGPLFTQAVTPTVVLTCTAAPQERLRAVQETGCEVVRAGDATVDLVAGLAALRARGLNHVLVEGGPRLNAALLAAGSVDELCLTIAPSLTGGHDPRRITDEMPGPVDLELLHVLHADGELLLRYRVAGRQQDRR